MTLKSDCHRKVAVTFYQLPATRAGSGNTVTCSLLFEVTIDPNAKTEYSVMAVALAGAGSFCFFGLTALNGLLTLERCPSG